MAALELHTESLRLVVDPDVGTGILAFHARVGDAWLPLMPDARRPDCDLAASSFLMVPYSNRIAQGRFSFQGTEHQLDNGGAHSIHGDVRKRPWRVVDQAAGALRCAFDSRDHEAVNWPWPFRAEVSHTLEGTTLRLGLTLTNGGDTPMPAGGGWHPYFSRTLTRAGEPVRLHLPVAGVYPDAHDTRIPSGPPQPPAPHQDFGRERELPPDAFLDTCCHGFAGGTIAWPDSGVRLGLAPTATCGHLVLYNPDKPYFAVEPVTNANDGVNLLARGDATAGTVVLEPGQSLQAGCDLIVETL